MLVICNGAQKGGSTWIVQIIKATGSFKRIPKEYQSTFFSNSSVDDDQFKSFFSSEPYINENYYIKQHWTNNAKYTDIATKDHVKVLNIVRDIRDVLISRYFHDLRIKATSSNDIEDYYWNDSGRMRIEKYIIYQQFWHDLTIQNRVFLCKYEDLKTDFINTSKDMFKFIGMNYSDEDTNKIKEKTSIKNKKTGKGNFFRKGIVGDWKNYLSEKTVSDIDLLCVKSGYYKLNIQNKISFENEIS